MPSSYTTDLPNKIVLDSGVLFWSHGDGTYINGDFAKSSEPEDFKTTRTAYYRISDAVYSKAATDGLDFTAAHVVTASKWGIVLVQINAAGTISTKVPASTQAYDTEAEAVAALPSADASNARMAYLLIHNNAGDWTANTDDLTNGSDVTTATFVEINDGMTKFGASRGGLTFNKNTEWRHVEFDGSRGETAGLHRKTGGVPTITGRLLLFDPDAVEEVFEPGSTSTMIGTDPNARRRITPLPYSSMLPLSAYRRYEMLGKRGNGGYVHMVFPLGLAIADEFSSQDNNEGEIPVTIRAVNNPDDIDGVDEVPAPYYHEFDGPDVTVA